MVEIKRRIRRTSEQRLADLETKQAFILERQRVALAKIEAEKKKIMKLPSGRHEKMEQEKRFARAVAALAPDWDFRHYIASIEKAFGGDAQALMARGEALLEEHGKARRGRRPRNS